MADRLTLPEVTIDVTSLPDVRQIADCQSRLCFSWSFFCFGYRHGQLQVLKEKAWEVYKQAWRKGDHEPMAFAYTKYLDAARDELVMSKYVQRVRDEYDRRHERKRRKRRATSPKNPS